MGGCGIGIAEVAEFLLSQDHVGVLKRGFTMLEIYRAVFGFHGSGFKHLSRAPGLQPRLCGTRKRAGYTASAS